MKRALVSAGSGLVGLGVLLLLANYSVLVEGHTAEIVARDAQGNEKLDPAGQPIIVPNPSCLEFEREQFRRTLLALAMMVAGVPALLLARRRGGGQPQSGVDAEDEAEPTG